MASYFKMYFGTEDDSTKMISVPGPKEGLTQNEAKTAMEGIRDAGAFDGISTVIKGVLYSSSSEVLYEA